MDSVENVDWRHESIIPFKKNLILGEVFVKEIFYSLVPKKSKAVYEFSKRSKRKIIFSSCS